MKPPDLITIDPRLDLVLALLVMAALAGVSPASGQVILNTESFQLDDVDGLHVAVDVSVSAQGGNSQVVDVSGSGIIGHLGRRHWPRLIFGGRYLADEDRSILDAQFLQARYSYLFSDRVRTFHFVQMQANHSLLVRSRWLLGTGVRRSIVTRDRTTLDVGTGVMGEWERLDPERLGAEDAAAPRALRMANLAVLTHDFEGGARIVNILYLQPDVEDLRDVRILDELALILSLGDRVSTRLSLEWRRDTRPPSTLGRDDLSLGMGLGVELR